jgi:hypothetical protein
MPTNQKIKRSKTTSYSKNYKDKLFNIWYEKGKPGRMRLWNIIPDDDEGYKPSSSVLDSWIAEWRERASILDEQVRMQIDAQLIKEKVEMLNRHANTGVKMQDMGLEYLDNHKDELNANTAVRLLVEGINIEQDSRGVGTALKKMMNMDNSELVDEISAILEAGDITISKIEE